MDLSPLRFRSEKRSLMGRAFAAVLLLSLLWAAQGVAAALPRSAPEAEGVSSDGISAFLDAFNGTNHEMHSVMLLRHGKVVAEGWWKPYAPELTHTMYSTSKSFTATAIGIAVGEGKLKVSDKVVSLFPELVPEPMPPHLADLTVQHLLTMTVGQDPDPTLTIPGTSDTWVKSFLETPIVKEPGSAFLYNSMASYVLSAIVTKVTGEKVIDYLTPRLFGPLGVSGIDWETDPQNINTGGWGLRLHTEDMAKFGQLFLQDGVWNGQRLLPEGWVTEASSFHIQQDPDRPAEQRATSDWHQGYCYQMWRCRYNAYRGDGAFGQYIVVMPDQDAVLAITSQTSNMQGVLNQVWEHLLPAMHDAPLPANPDAMAALDEKLEELSVSTPSGNRSRKKERKLSGKTYVLADNERNIRQIGYEFRRGKCRVHFEDDRGAYTIPMSAGEWYFSETGRRGPYLVARAKNHLTGLPPFRVACAYRWLEDGALELTMRYIESPHTETLVCRFGDGQVDIDVTTGVRAPFSIHGELEQ